MYGNSGLQIGEKLPNRKQYYYGICFYTKYGNPNTLFYEMQNQFSHQRGRKNTVQTEF